MKNKVFMASMDWTVYDSHDTILGVKSIIVPSDATPEAEGDEAWELVKKSYPNAEKIVCGQTVVIHNQQ